MKDNPNTPRPASPHRRAFVISGDKGNNNPDQFKGLMDPHIAVHGSFSVMVNYHSIGAYFTSRGGFALHNPQEEVRVCEECVLVFVTKRWIEMSHCHLLSDVLNANGFVSFLLSSIS